MEKTKSLSLVILFSMGIVLAACSWAPAAITIPIPYDLTGWSYPDDLYQSGNVYAVGGVGVLKEDEDVGKNIYLTSDAFTLDAGYRSLTFDLEISSGESPESDYFYAWLKDAGTHAVITPAPSSFVFPWTNHGQSGNIEIRETVSMLFHLETDKSVYLDFVLTVDGQTGYSSAGISNIIFSEATVEPPTIKIPAPGAFLLGCWGIALVGGSRRAGRKLIA